MCSVLSNHQAPSRDIALKMAELERFKQLVSGTYWISDTTKEPIQASCAIRRVLHETLVVQRQLGWAPKPKVLPKPGQNVPFHLHSQLLSYNVPLKPNR